MKQVLLLTLGLWLTHNINAQTKWIAHKSHSGKMSTFSLKSPDNLGCGRGDFLELKVSNFDVLGNECTRPLILANGMVIKDPKLDSAGFSASHKEVNKLSKADSVNYYPYKRVYDSIKDANYGAQVILEPVENIKGIKEEKLFIESPSNKPKVKKKKKSKENTSSMFYKKEPVDREEALVITSEDVSNISIKEDSVNTINKAELPIWLFVLLIPLVGVILLLKRMLSIS